MGDDVLDDLGHVVAERPVGPVVTGVAAEGRDEQIGGDPGVGQPENDHAQADDPLLADRARQ